MQTLIKRIMSPTRISIQMRYSIIADENKLIIAHEF